MFLVNPKRYTIGALREWVVTVSLYFGIRMWKNLSVSLIIVQEAQGKILGDTFGSKERDIFFIAAVDMVHQPVT